MKIRIKDIAEKANVSVGTVDRVLHKRGEVSEETRNKILDIVEEMNYKPDVLARTLASKKKYTIGILLPDPKSGVSFWKFHIQGIERAINELSHFGFQSKYFLFNFFDSTSFIQAYIELLQTEIDAVVLAPVFLQDSEVFMRYCNEKKIPCVHIDSRTNKKEGFTYIGQDSFQSGKVAAGIINNSTIKNGNISIINLTRDNDNIHIKERIDGFLDYFNHKNENFTINKIDIPYKGQITNEVKEILNNSINNSIDSIFVPNSRVYKIAEIIENKKLNKIKLVGFDLIDSNIDFLKKNIIHFLISQKPEEQGYKSIMSIFSHMILNREVSKVQYIPIDIITNQNLQYYNIDYGKILI